MGMHTSQLISQYTCSGVCVCALSVRRQMHTMLVCAGAYVCVLVVRKGIPKIAPPLGEAQDAWHRFPGKGAVVPHPRLFSLYRRSNGPLFAAGWFG